MTTLAEYSVSPLSPVSLPSVAHTARAKIPTTIAEKMNDSTGSQRRPFSDFRTAQLAFARAQERCMRVMRALSTTERPT